MSLLRSSAAASVTFSVDSLTRDFHGTLAALREHAPVTWVPDLGGWMVTTRLLVSEILRDPVRFTVDDKRFSTQRVIGPSMLSLDGAEHVRHRSPFDQAFRRGDSVDLHTRMTNLANDLVSGFADDFRADLRTSLAAPLAVAVMIDALGLVDVDASELLSWYADIVSSTTQTSLGASPSAAGRVAMGNLEAAIRRSLEDSDLLIRAAETLTVDPLHELSW